MSGPPTLLPTTKSLSPLLDRKRSKATGTWAAAGSHLTDVARIDDRRVSVDEESAFTMARPHGICEPVMRNWFAPMPLLTTSTGALFTNCAPRVLLLHARSRGAAGEERIVRNVRRNRRPRCRRS